MIGDLHLICGMVGAGKTTLAKKLEQSLPAIRFSPDEWIDPLLKTRHDREEMDRLRPTVEAFQWQTALRMLEFGCTVVLENGFWSIEERQQLLAEARAMGGKVTLHFLSVETDELKKRIEHRNKHLSMGTFYIDLVEIDEWLATVFSPPGKEELETYDSYKVYEAAVENDA